MKALIVGTGGVGESMAAIAKRRDPKAEIFHKMVLADYDLAKAQRASRRLGEERFPAEQVDAHDVDAVAALAEKYDVDIICNLLAVDFDIPMMQAALKARRHYLDTGMSLSTPHPTDPYNKVGELLGHEQFAFNDEFVKIGKLALLGQGIEPGMADYYARYAADHLFDEIGEIGVRDGATLDLPGHEGPAFVFLDLDDHRGVHQPGDRLGGRQGLQDREAVQRDGGVLPACRHRLPGDGPHRA